jgi:hypothetical protein
MPRDMYHSTDKRALRSKLRKFGVTVGTAFIVLGVVFLLRGKSFYPHLLAVGGALVLLGLLIPAALGPVHWVWMRLAMALGWLMTRVILTVLFFIIVTIVALLGRLARRDPLKLKFRDGADSYWIPRKETVRDRSDYERQY